MPSAGNFTMETVLSQGGLVAGNVTQKLSTGDVSDEVNKKTRLVCAGFIGLFLSTVGMPTNFLNCLVFWRQGLRDRMNLCLFCLSLVDLTLLSLNLGFSIVDIFCDLNVFGFGDEQYLLMTKYILGVKYAFRGVSGCYTVVIAVERCACVLFPLHALSLMRTRTMGFILAAILVILQAGYLTIPLKFDVVSYEVKGEIFWRLGQSKLSLTNQYAFDLILYTILSVSLPLVTFVLVSLATLVTVVKLRLVLKWRGKTSSTSGETHGHQTALTRVLIVVLCLYLVTMLPFVVYVTAHLLIPDFSLFGRLVNLYMTCSTVVNVFAHVNSCFNFFVYYNRSTRFRRDLASLWRHLAAPRAEDISSSTLSS